MENTSNNANTVLAPVYVYEFLYSDSCESVATISIHKTKKGAEMAMASHKAKKQKQWDEMEKKDPEYWKEYKWDFNRWWGIKECELLP